MSEYLDDVRDHIVRNYLDWQPSDGRDSDKYMDLDTEAGKIVSKHPDVTDKGFRFGSKAYYVGGEIMIAEGREDDYHGRGDAHDDEGKA